MTDKTDLEILGAECPYCGDWIILDKTESKGVLKSTHVCKELLKRRCHGTLKGEIK